jgi:TolB-like protein/Flp pilus assembly protein TadD
VKLRHFLDELQRRHVWRVTGVYLVAAYAVVQGAATIFPLLNIPNWVATIVVIIAALGLPVAILLAWVFDITPQGLRKTPDAAPVAEIPLEQQLEAHRRRFAARAVGFVGVGILVALVGFAAFANYTEIGKARPGAGERIESVAVLPFRDLSANRDQEYFADGVAEELLNRLAQIEGLRVPARTSSFAFKGRDLPINTIGDRLRVQAVLEGSIRREGDNLRVTAQLVDAKTGYQIWSNTYDRKISSVFAIQDEISEAIVSALKLQFAPSTPTFEGESHGTKNAHAQDLYFKGLKAFNERTDQQLRVALQYFQQAVEADSTYALAHAGLAKTFAVLPAFGDFAVVDALRKGSASAARAISLDPSLGEAHAALGQIAQNLEWDLTSALRSYRRAVKFSPKDATAHQWYAEALMLTGDLTGSATEIELALESDPLSPSAKTVRAYQALLRGDLPAALRLYQNLVRESPGFRLGQLNYAFAALAAKDYGAAAEALIAGLPELGPDVGAIVAAASAQGDRADAVAAIKSMANSQPASLVAVFYAAVGATDQAVQSLQAAFESGSDANLPYVLVHPLLKPLHTNPRFQQIVRTVGVTLPA